MTVYLVGAGPGDPGLMTARALELIAAADVIVYDRLIPDGALDGARADAKLIYAGKEGGGEQVPQSLTEELLVKHGSDPAVSVVRLKGGDPFVFGRGGEEAETLRAHGIGFEVVPGVSAGIAAPAYAGIPVTHRELASSVAFLTGHEDPAKSESSLDWRALAAFPGTLVVYMGVRQLGGIAERLIAGGRSGEEPVALVQQGTLPGQRTVIATLATVAAVAEAERVRPPTVAVFGPVAGLHQQLAWIEQRPLHGVSVAVTRARAQASSLVARLGALGAVVVEAPVIQIKPLAGPAPVLADYDLVCVTSANGVEQLFARLAADGLDARAFGAAKVAAIGPGTARALASRGIKADILPERFDAEGLVSALADVPVRRALIVRAAVGREVLPDALRERGAEVDVVAVYETVIEPLSADQIAAVAACNYVTATSASSARNLHEAAGGFPAGPRVISIGPVTSVALRELGHVVDVEAERHDLDGLVEALLADVAARA